MDYMKDGAFYEKVIDGVPFECITGIQCDKIVYQGRSQFQEILVFDR